MEGAWSQNAACQPSFFGSRQRISDVYKRQEWLRAERTEGYEGLRRRHMAAWEQYHRESGVQLPDRQMQEVYQTAQYDPVSYTHLDVYKRQPLFWDMPVLLCCTAGVERRSQ